VAATPATVHALSAHRSRPTTVEVGERDFHITAPAHVRAGAVDLHVVNRGPDDHELLVVRDPAATLPLRADGVTVNEEQLKPRIAGSLEAGRAGSRRTLRLHLRPGHYEMFCNMSGHYLGGMHHRFVAQR
jgi:uncharacterized cupredoxin-like copper-binding protein